MHQRRRRHGVDGEALLLAAGRRHLLHPREHGAVARRDEQRLARAPQHGDDLDEVVDPLRGVLGQTHAHDEVDVGEHLAERGHALDVGAADPAALAALRVAHVQHVRAGAVVDLAVAQSEWLGFAAARLEEPLPRRSSPAHPRPDAPGCAHGGRRPRRRRRGTARAPARSARRRPVSASSSRVASCRRRHSASPQTVSLASGISVPPSAVRAGRPERQSIPHGFPDCSVNLVHARNGMSSTYQSG